PGDREEERRMVRLAMSAYGGVDVGSDADTMLVVFADAGEAVAACLEAQRQLARERDPNPEGGMRMGAHIGLGRPSSEGAYASAAMYQAARICSAGHGGQ